VSEGAALPAELARFLDAAFPGGHGTRPLAGSGGGALAGAGDLEGATVRILGTPPGREVPVAAVVALAGALLAAADAPPPAPLLLLADGRGQRLAAADEVLGAARCSAHLAACVGHARRRGHPVLAVVVREAGGGPLVALAAPAHALYALPGARLHTLPPAGIERITGLDPARLARRSRRPELYSPEAASALAAGVLAGVWEGDPRAELRRALASIRERAPGARDSALARTVAARVVAAPPEAPA